MILLWPSGDRSNLQVVESYGGLSTQTGTVNDASIEPCRGHSSQTDGSVVECLVIDVVPDAGGAAVSLEVPPEITSQSSITEGSRVRFLDLGDQATAGQQQHLFIDFVRTVPMALLPGVYALAVIRVARWAGFRAPPGQGGALVRVLVGPLGGLPGLPRPGGRLGGVDDFPPPRPGGGEPAAAPAAGRARVIMIAGALLGPGFSARTSTALLGTIFGLVA